MNQIQVIGTHNSYHREISLSEREVFETYLPAPNFQNLYYSHSSLHDQLEYQHVRSFELDLHSDAEGGLYAFPLIWEFSNLTEQTAPWDNSVMQEPGLKVFHITDLDTHSVCHTFRDCLRQMKGWSDAHPRHVPLTVILELKSDALACSFGGVCADEASTWTLERILEVEREILEVLGRDRVVAPDDVRREGMTLEASVLKHGWPRLGKARGKFMFFFDNDPTTGSATGDIRSLYREGGHASLEGRLVFTNAVEGEEDAAFLKRNSPDVEEIQRLVKKGYLVRTRADEPITTILERNVTMREQALESAAQIVSTDFPAYGMSTRWDRDYAVQLGEGRVARCNEVVAPKWCRDKMLRES